MTDDAGATERAWWEAVPAGQVIPLAFVKIDRVMSTREWSELPPETVEQRYGRYTATSRHVGFAGFSLPGVAVAEL